MLTLDGIKFIIDSTFHFKVTSAYILVPSNQSLALKLVTYKLSSLKLIILMEPVGVWQGVPEVLKTS